LVFGSGDCSLCIERLCPMQYDVKYAFGAHRIGK
jgi:hypothetical protein